MKLSPVADPAWQVGATPESCWGSRAGYRR